MSAVTEMSYTPVPHGQVVALLAANLMTISITLHFRTSKKTGESKCLVAAVGAAHSYEEGRSDSAFRRQLE